MKRAAFLDRDGVLNRKPLEGHYVTGWDELHLLPGACEAVCLLNYAGFLVVVASNQRCVAKGLITSAEMDALHARMRLEFEAAGARIDAIYYCPHETQPPCSCRKPQPGMLMDAARTHNIELAESWMIGDSERDVQAGRAAGCKTVRLLPDDRSRDGIADIVASSFLAATHEILKHAASRLPLRQIRGGTVAALPGRREERRPRLSGSGVWSARRTA
jgi:D-glycero-D-manno-heptose 1,7-bisphosphate phosphatase